ADKPLIYVKKEWMDGAIGAVGETGKPPKDWFDECVQGVSKSGTADDPEAVCGNVWFNVLGEWAKRRVKTALEKKEEFRLPPEAKEAFTKLADELRKEPIKIPDNLFTRITKDAMSIEEQQSFDAMLLDIERQKRGLPPLRETKDDPSDNQPEKSSPKTEKA